MENKKLLYESLLNQHRNVSNQIGEIKGRNFELTDVAKWIEKVIDSCETYQQTFTAKKLITNFAKQLRTKSPDKYWRDYQYSVIWPLETMVTSKRQSFIDMIEE